MDNVREALFKYIELYRRFSLTVLPLQRRSKQCVIKSWDQLTPDGLLQYFKPDSNIGIRLDGLTCIDIERPELWPVLTDLTIETLSRATWVQKTGGGGYHILFRGEAQPFKIDGFAEIRSGNSQYIVVAPSIHPETGRQYEWISDIRSTPIAELDRESLDNLKHKLETLRRFKKFIELMTDCWKKYHRHNLALWLSGCLRKMGLPLSDAEIVLKAIIHLNRDEEIQDRLRALRDTYDKDNTKVKGWSGLREELIEITSVEDAERILKLLPIGKEQIDLEYVGGKKWRVVGLSRPSPPITISSGEQLLSSKRFAWLRRKVSEEKLFELAEKINETYEEEEKEKVEEEKPRWLVFKELLENAEKEVERKLEEFIGLPEGERVEKYHDWLRNVVLRDIMAGEDDNKVCAFVIILFGKKYILLLQGKSSIGKNLLVYSFICMTPHYKTNRVTRYGLDYLSPDEVFGKILYLKEAEDFEGHFGFVLKSLEDFEDEEWITYKVTYPVKDEKTGRITAYTQTSLKLKALISTTNIEYIQSQGVQERMFFIKLDDSTEQNLKVLQYIDREETQKQEIKQGLRKWTDREWSLALTYCLWRKLSEISDEILIPYDNLAEVVLGALASDTEVRRHARKLRRFVEWFARAFIIFLPVVEVNGKKVRLVSTDVLKLAVRYFYQLIEAKKEFKTPFVLKFAKKLIETYKDESNPNGQCIELRKTSREVLARKLGYRPDSLNRYLNQLHDEAPLAVEKYNVGKEVIHKINLQELATWASEFLDTQPLSLSDDQIKELEQAFNRWVERYTASHMVDLFLPTSKTSESGLIQADKPENVGKPVFPLFSERSELENLENGENDVGRKEGGVEGGVGFLSRNETLPINKSTLLQPSDGEDVENRVCNQCMHWNALKCDKHPDWIVVTPTARYARTCEFYTLRNNGGEGR
jgi:hypothetical protein